MIDFSSINLIYSHVRLKGIAYYGKVVEMNARTSLREVTADQVSTARTVKQIYVILEDHLLNLDVSK